jgi:hypothetical protein
VYLHEVVTANGWTSGLVSGDNGDHTPDCGWLTWRDGALCRPVHAHRLQCRFRLDRG